MNESLIYCAGVSLKDAIVLVKYGGIFRGLKVSMDSCDYFKANAEALIGATRSKVLRNSAQQAS